MRKITTLLIIFALPLMVENAFSQNEEPIRWTYLHSTAEQPLFITREGNTGDYIQLFSEWLRNNLRYPIMANEMELQGTVHVSYIIEKDGSIDEIEIHSYSHPVFRREVLRVLQNAPHAVPGRRSWNNEPAFYVTRVLMKAKVHFVHHSNITDDFVEKISDDVDINVTVIAPFISINRNPFGGRNSFTQPSEEIMKRPTFWQRITRIFR